MRPLSVAVNDVVGVAGFVIPGTRVDVLVTGNCPGAQGSRKYHAHHSRKCSRARRWPKNWTRPRRKATDCPVITLLVSPADAAKLTMASTEGKIQLALRNTVDGKNVNPPSGYASCPFLRGSSSANRAQGCASGSSHTTRAIRRRSDHGRQTHDEDI